jgi:putative phosphoesterase
MRVALLSDLHGNLLGLEAALDDLAGQNADAIVCLGDIAALGPHPRETVERLQGLDCPVVMGNTDEWLLNPQPPLPGDEVDKRAAEAELWSARQLAAAHLDFLRTFQPEIELALGGGQTLACFHASPLSNVKGILPATPAEELERLLAGRRATVMAFGHTHEQMLRRHGGITLVNPGSVGLPAETDPGSGRIRRPPCAEYALLESAGGPLSVEFRRAPYDVAPNIQAVLRSGMPHADVWARLWQTE